MFRRIDGVLFPRSTTLFTWSMSVCFTGVCVILTSQDSVGHVTAGLVHRTLHKVSKTRGVSETERSSPGEIQSAASSEKLEADAIKGTVLDGTRDYFAKKSATGDDFKGGTVGNIGEQDIISEIEIFIPTQASILHTPPETRTNSLKPTSSGDVRDAFEIAGSRLVNTDLSHQYIDSHSAGLTSEDGRLRLFPPLVSLEDGNRENSLNKEQGTLILSLKRFYQKPLVTTEATMSPTALSHRLGSVHPTQQASWENGCFGRIKGQGSSFSLTGSSELSNMRSFPYQDREVSERDQQFSDALSYVTDLDSVRARRGVRSSGIEVSDSADSRQARDVTTMHFTSSMTHSGVKSARISSSTHSTLVPDDVASIFSTHATFSRDDVSSSLPFAQDSNDTSDLHDVTDKSTSPPAITALHMSSRSAQQSRVSKRSLLSSPTPSIASSLFTTSAASVIDLRKVKLGVILPFHGPFPWVIAKTHPALVLAVEKIEQEELLNGHVLQLVLKDSQCSETYGPLNAIDLYVEKEAHVFIGPACDYAVAPVARFSNRWQIPVLTAGALVSAFHDRNEYGLLTRVQGAYAKAGEFVVSVFFNFRWRLAGLIYHDVRKSPNNGRSNCYFTVEAIFLAMRYHMGREPWYREFNSNVTDPTGYAAILMDLSRSARVVVLCASPDSVREIMIKAHELNFDNGEYVFFNIDLFSSKNDSQQPWYREHDTPERNAKARKAFEALMTVTLRKPTSAEYRRFSEEVKHRAAIMYPNFTYGEEEVNSFVGAFHDAVLLYALALNETLAANGSVSDGAAITRRMWNRTFEGITGNVSIDANGDRNADYSLLDLNPQTGKFEVVANYYGNKKRYEAVPGKSIHWAGGRAGPPPDTPVCGFDGSKCPPEEPFPEYGIVIIVLGSILIIVIVAVFFIYRHIKLEAELAEMNWRVKWEDILFGSPEKNKKLERQGSKLSLVRRNSYASSASGDTIAFHLSDAGNRQLFTKTGYYKGAIIAIKSIARSSITVSKPLLLEIKRMKDLQNDHIVRFIGACIDYPNQCILTEYCPKGSLQDVLENDQIKLDWMFRYSIMQDIVRGMAYLNGTDIRSHGNLKSTNCVVDSRFVVKITDFGLHYFRSNCDAVEEENAYRNFHSQLWTAPELLRMHSRPLEGTLKGDVYSFAIICQEIVYRNGVFHLLDLDLTPEEIYVKVKNGVRPYFRPMLEEYDCPCDELADVIRRCWAEDPSDRPDFTQLKSIIRKLNRDGDKGNILDNLLSRMEQYANNLEALVEERTADYLQQKKKAEDLLYSMLPRSVALQLIRGESVTAESYDCVSIYFSDICGFTAMSAESTPMQVVDLLNDLYTTFDSIIENFDVYKVETIGDAYMVVSGLPERNGDLHAREIARMSLSLLDAVMSFRIRHRPKEQLKLRIGIHTGPVCTGVVGHKMPRYCLFGDTVNTASRMESNGLPLRIHVSPATKVVLDRFGTFELESRGEVEMKGKGLIHTYWLLGERTLQDSPATTLNIL